MAVMHLDVGCQPPLNRTKMKIISWIVACWQALFAFNDILSSTDYILNTCPLKRQTPSRQLRGLAVSEVNNSLSALTTRSDAIMILVFQTWYLGLRTDLPRGIPAWASPCRTYTGRQLRENPFVKLTALHGHGQPAVNGGAFELLSACTKRSVQPVFSGRFSEGFGTHRHLKTHTHTLTSPSHTLHVLSLCLSSRHTLQQMQSAKQRHAEIMSTITLPKSWCSMQHWVEQTLFRSTTMFFGLMYAALSRKRGKCSVGKVRSITTSLLNNPEQDVRGMSSSPLSFFLCCFSLEQKCYTSAFSMVLAGIVLDSDILGESMRPK